MLDRLKGEPADQTEAEDRKKDERKLDSGMPRFQPQPGGFGRRATPVSGVAESKAGEITLTAQTTPVPTPTPTPAPTSAPRKAEQPAGPIGFVRGFTASAAGNAAGGNGTTPMLGDVPTRIADWLMRELKDQRGVHCETMLTVVGALAGYAAQQALWEGMVKPGKLAITQAFKVMEMPSGETFFFGDALDIILASMEPKHLSIWKIVAGSTLTGGGEHLPDIPNLLRHCEATAGTSQFGLPRLPDDHLPSILPRLALERFWPGARLLLALAEPLTWPLHMANAAQKLMLAMKGSIAPDLAVKIVMEAAVPMSRVDPTTVPNN
jgi:hypothetical protein